MTMSFVIMDVVVSCTSTPTAEPGHYAGSCQFNQQPQCSFLMECIAGECLQPQPAPPQGANRFPDVGGLWATDPAGTCTGAPGFASSMGLMQCGPNILVVSSDTLQVRPGVHADAAVIFPFATSSANHGFSAHCRRFPLSQPSQTLGG